jgi:hypothetical protein
MQLLVSRWKHVTTPFGCTLLGCCGGLKHLRMQHGHKQLPSLDECDDEVSALAQPSALITFDDGIGQSGTATPAHGARCKAASLHPSNVKPAGFVRGEFAPLGIAPVRDGPPPPGAYGVKSEAEKRQLVEALHAAAATGSQPAQGQKGSISQASGVAALRTAACGSQVEQYLVARIMEWTCLADAELAVHNLTRLMNRGDRYACFVARKLMFLDLDVGLEIRRRVLVPRMLLAEDCNKWFPLTVASQKTLNKQRVQFIVAAVARWFDSAEAFAPVLRQAVLDARDTSGAVSWVWIEFAWRWLRDAGELVIPFVDEDGKVAITRADVVSMLIALRTMECLGVHEPDDAYSMLHSKLKLLWTEAPVVRDSQATFQGEGDGDEDDDCKENGVADSRTAVNSSAVVGRGNGVSFARLAQCARSQSGVNSIRSPGTDDTVHHSGDSSSSDSSSYTTDSSDSETGDSDGDSDTESAS